MFCQLPKKPQLDCIILQLGLNVCNSVLTATVCLCDWMEQTYISVLKLELIGL